MSIQTITHAEYHCADVAQTAAELQAGFGFRREAEQPAWKPGVRTVHLRQGTIRLRLLSSELTDHPVARWVERHGEGVAVLALGCTDPAAALERAERHGAEVLDRAGALIAGFGDTALRFVPLPDSAPEAETGSEPVGGELPHNAPEPAVASEPVGGKLPHSAPEPAVGDLLDALDHVAICVPAGRLAASVRFCEAALGMRLIFGEYIEVGEQAMDSSVVQSPSGDVTFTLIEPDTGRRAGQIDTFLADHDGAGVQHLALRTDDIATAVRTARARGIEFLATPGAYYDGLAERLGDTAIPVGTLRELDVLVDQDHGGQLFQIFARSTHPRRTFFLELIERQGAGTFGTANIKALYEAVERQRAAASV